MEHRRRTAREEMGRMIGIGGAPECSGGGRLLRRRRGQGWILALAVVSCAGEPPPGGPERGELDKIDPALHGVLDAGDPLPVILLLDAQLLGTPGSLDDFAEEHRATPRASLRALALDSLRRVAARTQGELRQELGLPDSTAGTWLVNALFPELDGPGIRRAAARPDVRYVFRGGGRHPPASGAPGPALPPLPPGPSPEPGRRAVTWNVEALGAPEAWAQGVTGEGVVVQVLDFGTEITHPDLVRRLWRNPGEVPGNGLDDDGNGWIDDAVGFDFGRNSGHVDRGPNQPHGTFTAGIVVGDGSDGVATGVAPRARLQVALATGLRPTALALEYALTSGTDIVTMSFSIPDLGALRSFWRLMADQATAAGLILVSGAGNFRQTADLPVQQRIPEGIPSVISVGGVERDGTLAVFSSMGPVSWSDVPLYRDHPALTKPDVVAYPGPGYPVLAAGGGYVDPDNGPGGNSFSGPQAAGVAALVLSANPDLKPWEVRRILETTARDLDEPGKDNRTGWGLLDAAAAVAEARRRR